MNQRPHPYQRSTAKRCANRPFRWSCSSVSPTRMGRTVVLLLRCPIGAESASQPYRRRVDRLLAPPMDGVARALRLHTDLRGLRRNFSGTCLSSLPWSLPGSWSSACSPEAVDPRPLQLTYKRERKYLDIRTVSDLHNHPPASHRLDAVTPLPRGACMPSYSVAPSPGEVD